MKSGVDYAKDGWEVVKKELVNNIIVFFVASLTVMVLGIGIVSMFYCANKARKGEKLEIGDALWGLKNNPVQNIILCIGFSIPVRRPRFSGDWDMAVDRARRASILDIADKLGLGHPKRRGVEWAVLCPLHDDSRPSLLLKPRTSGPDFWYCHPCGLGGDGIELVKATMNMSFADAVRWLN